MARDDIGAQILRGGRRYICNRKDGIIHGLSPSVKCVAPLLRDMSLAKVGNAGGGTPPPSCAPGSTKLTLIDFFSDSETCT